MFIHEQTLEDRAAKARGDSTLSGSLIREFKPFIASVCPEERRAVSQIRYRRGAFCGASGFQGGNRFI